MIHLLAFRFFFIISICTADTVNMIIGNVYNQMNDNFATTSLAQLNINTKLTCAIQCAYYFPNCPTAVFDASSIHECFLYSEKLTPAQLFVSTVATIYDFQQTKLQSRTFLIKFSHPFKRRN